MKKLSASLVALTAALIVAPSAHADTTPGWYAAAGVGVGFPIDPSLKVNGVKANGTYENASVAALGAVGYAFESGLRLEGEYFYNKKEVKTISGVARGGHVTNNILFLNALYDFNRGSFLTPYVGAGVGADLIHVKKVGTAAVHLDGEKAVFAYQGIVGVSAQLDYNWAITADYRYVGSLDPEVSYSTGGKGRISSASHNMIFGLRYTFGEPEAVRVSTPPVVQPRPAVQPYVAPVSQNFTVFFDFDKSTITPEAKAIIAAAAQKFNNDGFAKIIVTGHTDTVGTEEYNQKLSERRAAAVKKELALMGVASTNIKDKGVGKSDLLVPTTDGVREAQNRRAEIVLEK